MEQEHNLGADRQVAYQEIENIVGNTPLIEITGIHIPNGNRIFAKDETRNPTYSNFSRVYPELLKSKESQGLIIPGVTPLIESTSGNAGPAMVWAAQRLGYGIAKGGVIHLSSDGVSKEELLRDARSDQEYPLDRETKEAIEADILPLDRAMVIIPVDMHKARTTHARKYNARVLFTPAGEYGSAMINLLENLVKVNRLQNSDKPPRDPSLLFVMTKIFQEARKPYYKLIDEAHDQLHELCPGRYFDYVFGVGGSGDYISGTGERLKQVNPNAKVVVIQDGRIRPLSSLREGRIAEKVNVTADDMPGSTAPGAGGDKFNFNWKVIDDVKDIYRSDWEFGQRLLEQCGYYVGKSSSAELIAALTEAERVKGKTMLIAFHDPAWNYTDTFPYSN